jgi:hypothetical protein
MCALLIVMIIIIVVSGIIVFGVIITVKYFNEEDADKIGPVLKRVVMWQLPNDNNVSESVEVKWRVKWSLQDPHALQTQRVARTQVDSSEQTTQSVQLS